MAYTDWSLEQKARRRTFSQVGLACFTILAVSISLQLLSNYLIIRFAPQWIGYDWYFWAVTFIPLYVIGVPIGIALFRRIPKETVFSRKLRFKDLLIFLVMSFPIMYVGNLIGAILSSIFHAILGTPNLNPLDQILTESNFWLSALFMVVLAPVIEEFIFRKLIIDRLRSYGEAACVIVSATLFGLFHGNFNQFFYAFGLGALFAFLYCKTGRVRYTIAMHMTINLLGGVIAPILLKGMDLNALADMSRTDPNAILRYLSDHLPQLLGFGLYSMINFSLVITGLILLIVRRRAFYFEQGPLQIQRGAGFRTIFLNVGMSLFFVASIAMFVLSLL